MTLPTVVQIAVLLVSLTVHETAHGLAAERLGDPTARALGRVSLNPLRHLDPFMSVILPGILVLSGAPFVFGAAKPVPVDPRYFRNPRRDMALVAAAGPASNLLIAATAAYAFRLAEGAVPSSAWGVLFFLFMVVIINVGLATFNLLPVPPLDGGRIVTGLLPENAARAFGRLERFGFVVVLLLVAGGLTDPLFRVVYDVVKRFLGIDV